MRNHAFEEPILFFQLFQQIVFVVQVWCQFFRYLVWMWKAEGIHPPAHHSKVEFRHGVFCMMRLLLIWLFCFLVTFLCFSQRRIRVVFYVTQRRKVLCFIFLEALREFRYSSTICVTEVFRIKKTVSKNLDRITGWTGLNLTIVFHKLWQDCRMNWIKPINSIKKHYFYLLVTNW